MAPQRKRDNRENAYFNVGVQGRKTGITLEERARDEHGIEAISGIFSSPEKSPPKRGSTVTGSESMDIQESSIPNITTSAAILRNNRTHLPPPRARSPMKTALGSSPRRQSSMAPRGSSVGASSPIRATSHPAVARRLDFQEEEESSLQETPALSGSGQRRGKRNDVYTLERSPSRPHSAVMEESELQEEITANNDDDEDLPVVTEIEESFVAQIGDDTVTGADAVESLVEEETQVEEEVVPEPVKVPAKRGRKRKSDQAAIVEEESPKPTKARKRGAGAAQALEPPKKEKKTATIPAAPARRSKRVSDITEQEPSVLEATSVDNSIAADASEQIEAPVAPKRRGRPPRVQKDTGVEPAPLAKTAKKTAAKNTAKEKVETVFKKPSKPVAKPKEKPAPKDKENVKSIDKVAKDEAGRPVDAYGNPLSKADIEQMSTTSVGSRYGRGRHLSIFREMEPEAVARVGRTGRHRVAPIDFWKNDRINYNHDGSMQTIVKAPSPEPIQRPSAYNKKGRKKVLSITEDEEVELDPWEEDDGFLTGNYKDFDPENEFTSPGLVEGVIAWSEKGVKPEPVGDGSFQYARVGNTGPSGFFNWGMIEIRADQMKRSKNSRKMHMVFNVQYGAVEVKVHENEFTVHRGGIWQVPRGNTYSIKNVGSKTARIFFAQARQTSVDEE